MSDSISNGDAPTPQSTGSTEAISETQAPQQMTPAEIRKFKVKVDGQEMEVDENELLTGYQTRKAADKRFQEASELRKQSEEFAKLLKNDPIKLLSDPRLGHNFREMAEKYLYEQLQYESLSPQERELKEAKEKLQAYEKEEKSKKEAAEQAQRDELRSRYAQDYQSKIVAAIQTSGLPASEHTVKKMAFYMHEGLKRGYKLEPSDVIDLVREDYVTEQKQLFGGLDPAQIIEMLGPDLASKIRQHDIAKLSNNNQLRTPENQEFDSKPKVREKQDMKQWRKKMDAIKYSK